MHCEMGSIALDIVTLVFAHRSKSPLKLTCSAEMLSSLRAYVSQGDWPGATSWTDILGYISETEYLLSVQCILSSDPTDGFSQTLNLVESKSNRRLKLLFIGTICVLVSVCRMAFDASAESTWGTFLTLTHERVSKIVKVLVEFTSTTYESAPHFSLVLALHSLHFGVGDTLVCFAMTGHYKHLGA